MLRSLKETFTWEHQREARMRTREVERKVSSIRVQARRCSNQLSHDDCQAVADRLLNSVEDVEVCHSLFTRIRSEFFDMASQNLKGEKVRIISAAPVPLLGTI
eukprot:5509054-Pyramimonas_sp.AAC.1